ncbi:MULTISPECIES: hypothetical protein [unclassified Duganella]|uniref:hypothetical protein n=1 Tax=unclassified Duganella TaxID=2636909 RepID=UPI0011C164E4|nr:MULTISPECIES: hypothetical protein [unclassified Duganella]
MKISKIELLGSLFLKIFAIQSMRQLGSYIAATLIGFLIFQAGLIFFGEPVAEPITLLLAFAGSSVVLRMTLPARFYIAAGSPERCAAMKEFLAKKIKKQGYNIMSRSDGETIFQSKLPAPLKWEENEILMTESDMTLMLKGPVFIIRMLHRYSSGVLSD